MDKNKSVADFMNSFLNTPEPKIDNEYYEIEEQYFRQFGHGVPRENLYRFTHFLDFPFGAIFANLLVGEASPIPFEHHLPMMATRFSIVSQRTVE